MCLLVALSALSVRFLEYGPVSHIWLTNPLFSSIAILLVLGCTLIISKALFSLLHHPIFRSLCLTLLCFAADSSWVFSGALWLVDAAPHSKRKSLQSSPPTLPEVGIQWVIGWAGLKSLHGTCPWPALQIISELTVTYIQVVVVKAIFIPDILEVLLVAAGIGCSLGASFSIPGSGCLGVCCLFSCHYSPLAIGLGYSPTNPYPSTVRNGFGLVQFLNKICGSSAAKSSPMFTASS